MDCATEFDNFRAVATLVVIALISVAILLMANLAYFKPEE